MRLSPLLLLSAIGFSDACTCMMPGTVSQRREDYPITVHARILGSELEGSDGLGMRKLTVAVLKDYSLDPGGLPDTLVFWTAGDGGACGTNLPAGTEAILFGDTAGLARQYQGERPANAFTTNLCAGNIGESGVAQAVAELEGIGPASLFRPKSGSAGTRVRERPVSRFLFLHRYGADGRCVSDP